MSLSKTRQEKHKERHARAKEIPVVKEALRPKRTVKKSAGIPHAVFVKGIRGSDSILETPLPQIAFVGRSNVGKSSSINALLGVHNLARTSRTPGKTQEINFFLVNDNTFFVDLPGYGYAKLPVKEAETIDRKSVV